MDVWLFTDLFCEDFSFSFMFLKQVDHLSNKIICQSKLVNPIVDKACIEAGNTF